MDSEAKRYGWVPDVEFLSDLNEAVKDVGKKYYFSSILLRYFTNSAIDPDAYLSDNTLDWCKETLRHNLDHVNEPAANEFLCSERHYLVPAWYREFRILARNHLQSGTLPQLSIAPKPETLREWRIRQRVIAEIDNEVDTFGLIETGQMSDNNAGREHTSDSDLF